MSAVLELVRAANTGLLLWNDVGHLVQRFLETGQDATEEEVEQAAATAQVTIDELRKAIEWAKKEK
jgi:secreted PhoX family phosphatase